ncbi:LapA family protein [Acaryochloris sp. IP29b_bin.148]|uniref:LapA family protein n=1 Tax=Acaryochloris sp. IP29b_bin.148 TaxID=2969218 RepID=UPI00261098EA|nr:LapA family protein [Acaryochloris sp. IP29b_bin.148]
MPILVVCALLISLVAILFALQNSWGITVSFLIWRFYGSLALILLLTLAFGVIIGLLVTAPTIIKRGWVSSRQKRQLSQLEEEYQGQAQDASSQRKKLDLMQATQMQLFTALGLTETKTGLLTYRSLDPVLSYALGKMVETSEGSWYQSTCLFVIDLEGVPSSDAANSSAVWLMITRRLQHQLSPRSWLHSGEQNRLYCVTLGMTIEAATDYGEFLSSTLDEPLQLVDGSEVSVKLRMGGAIARQNASITSQQLLTQAAQTLERSSLWGRSRFRMVEAGTS